MATKLEQLLIGVLAAGVISTSIPQSVHAKDNNYSPKKESVESQPIKYDPARFADLGVYESGKNIDPVVQSISASLLSAAPQDDKKPCPPYLIGKPGCPAGTPTGSSPVYTPKPTYNNPNVPTNAPTYPQQAYSPSGSGDNTGWYLISAGAVAMVAGALITPWSVCDKDPYASTGACDSYKMQSAAGLGIGLGGLGLIIWGIVDLNKN